MALAKLTYVDTFSNSILSKVKIFTRIGNLIHLHNILKPKETMHWKPFTTNFMHCKYIPPCVCCEKAFNEDWF